MTNELDVSGTQIGIPVPASQTESPSTSDRSTFQNRPSASLHTRQDNIPNVKEKANTKSPLHQGRPPVPTNHSAGQLGGLHHKDEARRTPRASTHPGAKGHRREHAESNTPWWNRAQGKQELSAARTEGTGTRKNDRKTMAPRRNVCTSMFEFVSPSVPRPCPTDVHRESPWRDMAYKQSTKKFEYEQRPGWHPRNTPRQCVARHVTTHNYPSPLWNMSAGTSTHSAKDCKPKKPLVSSAFACRRTV